MYSVDRMLISMAKILDFVFVFAKGRGSHCMLPGIVFLYNSSLPFKREMDSSFFLCPMNNNKQQQKELPIAMLNFKTSEGERVNLVFLPVPSLSHNYP